MGAGRDIKAGLALGFMEPRSLGTVGVSVLGSEQAVKECWLHSSQDRLLIAAVSRKVQMEAAVYY